MQFYCACYRSNKQGCSASLFLSGTAEAGALVVQSLNVAHTCTVQEHYEHYADVRLDMPDETRETVATMLSFSVRCTEIAMFLRDKGCSNITLKDISNWRQRLRATDHPQDEMQVSVMHCLIFFSFFIHL